MDDTTQLLLTRALEGDSDARGALLDRHVARLRAFVRPRLGARLRARETSQDIVQSVFREALGGLEHFEPRGSGSFRNWLLRTADRKLKSRARFWGRMRRTQLVESSLENAPPGEGPASPDASPTERAVAQEELERIAAAFSELPDDWREVVVLVRLQGLSHEQAARRLGRSVGATRTLLSRALARLATRLERDGGSS